MLREHEPMSGVRRYSLDDLMIDTQRQRVERAGVALDVSGLSFQLLAHLLQGGERVATYDELIATVWAPAIVNEETVTQRVKLLRQALGDDGRNPRYIRSVRGRGYQLCHAPVAAPTAVAADRQPHKRAALLLAMVAVLLPGVATVAWHAMRHDVRPDAAAPSPQGELLQRARYYAGIGQNDNNERAIELYQQILASDAHNVAAQLGLSFAYSARVCLYNFSPDWAQRAGAFALAVVDVQPDNSLAHSAAGYAHDCLGEIDAAIAQYEQAMALNPDARSDSIASVANLYEVKGRLADALRLNLRVSDERQRLRFLDIQIAHNLELLGFAAAAEQRYEHSFRLYPDNVFSNVAYPRFLFLQGRFSQARQALEQAMSRPQHPDLHLLAGELALLRGDTAAAQAAFARAASLRAHTSLPATLAKLYADAPPDDAWIDARIDVATRALTAGAGWPNDWLEIALLQLHRNDRTGAIATLKLVAAAGYADRAYLQTSALFRSLASEPGFAEVIDTISRHVAAERQQVLDAEWLPPGLLQAVKAEPAK